MADLKYTNGIFMGRILVGSGQQKDGTNYNKYKCTFKPNMESQKTFSMTEFQTDKSPLQAMQENQMYNLGYTEYHGQGPKGPYVSKTLQSVNLGAGSVTPHDAKPSQQQQIPQATADGAFQTAMVDYLNAIRTAVQKNPADEANLKVPTRMLGAILLKSNPVTFKPLFDLCKQALDNFKV